MDSLGRSAETGRQACARRIANVMTKVQDFRANRRHFFFRKGRVFSSNRRGTTILLVSNSQNIRLLPTYSHFTQCAFMRFIPVIFYYTTAMLFLRV